MNNLDKLAAEIRACRICVERPLARALPHEPRPVVRLSATARICICAQAPGIRVHNSGLSFSDPSGDRLRDWMGIDAETFYDVTRVSTVPMGFCFPGHDAKGGDLPPRRECVRTWHDRIFQEMPHSGQRSGPRSGSEAGKQSKLLLIIGQYAQAYHLGSHRRKSLTETVRAWREYLEGPGGLVRFALPHPSWRNTGWLKKNPWFEAELIPVLRQEVARRL